MLRSMTGFGEAQRETERFLVSVELRTVNNRYLKVSTRLSEGYAAMEPKIEATIRRALRRGTVQVAVRIAKQSRAADVRLNLDVLNAYREQVLQLCEEWDIPQAVDLPALLALPEVIVDRASVSTNTDEINSIVEDALAEAIEGLQAMRAEEGRYMETDLRENLAQVAAALERIKQRAPEVVTEHRDRLRERVQRVLSEHELTLEPSDLIREVAIFADRCDISEEIVRLGSHLEQFHAYLDATDAEGRKLDFLIQEMVRETNTIGSKANDVAIAKEVVEIKAAIERIREMIQNVE